MKPWMRALLTFVVLIGASYVWGAPGLKHARPGMLDEPLTSLHNDINTIASGDVSKKDLEFFKLARGSGKLVGF